MTDTNGQIEQFDGDAFGFEGHESAPNPLLIVHRCLRGRYLYAITFGLVLGVVGAIGAYNALKPKYTGVAGIEIRPVVDRLLYRTDENEPMPMFESFVNLQATRLQSERVLFIAVEELQNQNIGWPAGNEGIRHLSRNIKVLAPRGSQNVQVLVTIENPVLARDAANAVIDAYVETHGDELGLENDRKLEQLQRRRSELQRDIDRKQREIEGVVARLNQVDVESLESNYARTLQMVEQYDTFLNNIEVTLLSMGADLTPGGADGEASPEAVDELDFVGEITLAELALDDSVLSDLMQELDELEARRDSLRQRFGENHRLMKDVASRINELMTLIDNRAEHLRAAIRMGGDAAAGPNLGAMSAEALQARRAQYLTLRADANTQLRELAEARRQIFALMQEQLQFQELYNETNTRWRELNTEDENLAQRLQPVRAEIPVLPSKDRRIPMAGVGAVGGMGVGVGLVFLFGLIRPTFRYIDDIDAAHQGAHLLGTLPDFSGKNDADRDMAAFAVHHLRNALRVEPRAGVGAALTVTSAASGDGKTCLVMALGTSFAAAGHRTIIVDCDLVGRGLTRELQLENSNGLADAIRDPSAKPNVQPAGVDGLMVLTAGTKDLIEAKQLSPGNTGALLQSLRKQADVILIDTGPLLGSLEANIVATLSDSVIVTVSRGQHARLVRATIDRLSRMGAHCAGLVFNRASSVDFRHSVSHASIHSESPGTVYDRPASGSEKRVERTALMHAVAGRRDLALEDDQTP